jgi:hypothetical protein
VDSLVNEKGIKDLVFIQFDPIIRIHGLRSFYGDSDQGRRDTVNLDRSAIRKKRRGGVGLRSHSIRILHLVLISVPENLNKQQPTCAKFFPKPFKNQFA